MYVFHLSLALSIKNKEHNKGTQREKLVWYLTVTNDRYDRQDTMKNTSEVSHDRQHVLPLHTVEVVDRPILRMCPTLKLFSAP
jgi:hypothetical protein